MPWVHSGRQTWQGGALGIGARGLGTGLLWFATILEMAEEAMPEFVSPEEFILSWPLYTQASVDDFRPPETVNEYCPNIEGAVICQKETTWKKADSTTYCSVDSVIGSSFSWIGYVCGRCGKRTLVVVYREVSRVIRTSNTAPSSTRSAIMRVTKVGQFPALQIRVPKELEKALGEPDASLYRKALANRNIGNGLGAVAYMRRIVENKTNDLIEVVAKLAESNNIDAPTVAQIRAASTGKTTYDQKLKLAATVFPPSLLVETINPLERLYSVVSEGLHGLSEEECVAVADKTQEIFEFLFTHLRATTAARHDFAERIKKLTSPRQPKIV